VAGERPRISAAFRALTRRGMCCSLLTNFTFKNLLRYSCCISMDGIPSLALLAWDYRSYRASVFLMPSKQIDLNDPNLGQELLKQVKSDLPLAVWESYCSKYCAFPSFGGQMIPQSLHSWRIDLSDPEFAPLPAQSVVDEAFTWAAETLRLLRSDQATEAMETAIRTVTILVRGASFNRPKRGQPATMRPNAVRAYIVQKFNRDPQNKKRSTVTWSDLANRIFVERGRCTRCAVPRHQHSDACVKALFTAVGHLKHAMKREGVPV
jgi:hypothetical protein